MTVEGVITYIGPKETVGQNALLKQSFIVQEETDREFKNSIMIDCIKEKTDLLNGLSVGDKVKVSLNSRTNQYNGRYFNSISARKIEGGNGGSGSSKSTSSKKDSTDDDLPF